MMYILGFINGIVILCVGFTLVDWEFWVLLIWSLIYGIGWVEHYKRNENV